MLELVMNRVQAWELLNNTSYSSQLTMTEFYSLLLKAGYSPEAAHKAATQRGWDRLEAGEVM